MFVFTGKENADLRTCIEQLAQNGSLNADGVLFVVHFLLFLLLIMLNSLRIYCETVFCSDSKAVKH